MSQDRARALPKSIWYGREPETPEVGETLDVLALHVEPAEGPAGPTAALFGVARVGTELAETYGSRVAGATALLAFDEVTGEVRSAVPERVDSAPIQPILRSPAELKAMEAVTTAIESCFNVDVADQLALPPLGRRHRFALWLDDLCSPVVACDVPEDLARGVFQVRPTIDPAALSFVASGAAPEVVPGGLALSVAAAERLQDVRVTARLDTDTLTQVGDELVTVTALTRGQLERQVRWCTWRLTAEHLRSLGGALTLAPFTAAQASAPAQRWYVGLLVGDHFAVARAPEAER